MFHRPLFDVPEPTPIIPRAHQAEAPETGAFSRARELLGIGSSRPPPTKPGTLARLSTAQRFGVRHLSASLDRGVEGREGGGGSSFAERRGKSGRSFWQRTRPWRSKIGGAGASESAAVVAYHCEIAALESGKKLLAVLKKNERNHDNEDGGQRRSEVPPRPPGD